MIAQLHSIEDSSIDRLPPHSVDLEEAVLGAILLDPNAIARVTSLLTPQSFYFPAHGQIYQAALALQANNTPVDLLSVSTWLHEQGKLEMIGGRMKLTTLLDRALTSANIDVYAARLHEKHLRRQLISLASEQQKLAYDQQTPIEEVIDSVEQNLYRLNRGASDRSMASVGDVVQDVFFALEEGVDPGLATGFYDLDAVTGGLHPGNLITIAGATGMGKSHAVIGLSAAVATRHNLPVVIFTMEMTKEEVTMRLLAHFSGIDSSALARRTIADDQWAMLAHATAKLATLPIYIFEASNPSITEMRSHLRRIKAEHGLGLVVLDYLQLLGDGSDNRVRELDRISKGCKNIAKDFHVPFVALAQINRAVTSRAEKRPELSDLRESGAIEQDSNQVIFLYRDEYYNPESPERGLIELIVRKNRGGSVGTCKMLFDPRTSLFRNLRKP